MHYCGVIVKPKGISVEEAREIAGNGLVERDIAEWYSTGDYRERLFDNDENLISLEEFSKIFAEEKWYNDFYVLDNEGYIDYFLQAEKFWQFELEDREKLQTIYKEVYLNEITRILNSLDLEKYDVTLIDYHN